LDRGTQNGVTNGNASATASGTSGSATRSVTSVAASFDSFLNRKTTDSDAQDSAVPGAGDGPASKGLFQNVRITADTVNNAVVIYANQEDYRTIERAIRDFDRPRLQVAIDATVAEVTLTNELTYGVQYYLTSKDLNAGTDKGTIGLVNAVTAAA